MATVLTPPAVAACPGPFLWTVAQYRELYKLDALRDVRTVLIRGVIYTAPDMSPPLATALGLTEQWLWPVVPTGCHMRSLGWLVVGTDSLLRPGVAVVPGAIRDYSTRFPATARLVVEAAESFLALDTTTKAEVYATAGVPDYWVVDLVNRRLLVFRDPEPLPEGLEATAYRSRREYGPDDTVSPLAAPKAAVKVADLLP